MTSSNVERIKERLDIVDVIGSYVKLDKAGRNYKAKSPFTNEKTPSFYVSPERQLYYCFSSGKGGDIFTFVQEMEGTDFKGALKVLADRAGIALEFESKGQMDARDRLYDILLQAQKFFEQNLLKEKEAREYLVSRGLEKKTILEWHLGYAPNDWRQLKDFLSSKKVKVDEMRKVGLIKDKDYDTFRDRIIFPIFDTSGRTVAFSGRILHPNDKAPKYLNSPDTVLFKKSNILYGLHAAKTAIRRKDYSILVEGQMDLVMSHQAGIQNTVASSGTAITESHLKRLQQLSNRILISFDSDEAGFKAANKTATLALSMGMEVKVVKMPEGKDPADIILEGADKWKTLLKDSKHIIDFYIDRLLEKEKDRRKLALEISKHVLPYVAGLESDIEKSHFVSRIAKETGFREDAVWEDLKKLESGPVIVKNEEKVVQKETPEDRIAAIYYWQKTMKDPLIDVLEIENKLKEIGAEKIVKDVDPQRMNKVLFQIEQNYGTKDILNKDLKELYRILEIHILNNKKEALIPQIQKEDEKAKKEFNDISKRLEELK